MHHAAMADGKEAMYLLARLGCDWRTRAEGVDGATAAFVLCGQHGRTTRQQAGPHSAHMLRFSTCTGIDTFIRGMCNSVLGIHGATAHAGLQTFGKRVGRGRCAKGGVHAALSAL